MFGKNKSFFFVFLKILFIKFQFIEQIQKDLTERSTLHISINNQLSQENKTRMTRITELEQALSQEEQRVSFFLKKIKSNFPCDDRCKFQKSINFKLLIIPKFIKFPFHYPIQLQSKILGPHVFSQTHNYNHYYMQGK